MKNDDEYMDEWNQLHCKCIEENLESGREYSDAADYRNNTMADYCEDMILKAKDSYYNSDVTIMSDRQYDKLEDYLKALRPDSKVLKKVGS